MTPAKRGSSTKHVDTHGVRCCIIDFTFSRLTTGDGQVCYRPYDDDAYFEGEGDYQFDIYRSMREIVRKEMIQFKEGEITGQPLDWSGYFPRTNIYWMHYLVDKLLDQVTYACNRVKRSATTSSRKPKTTRSSRSKRGDNAGGGGAGAGAGATIIVAPEIPLAKVALEEVKQRLLLYRSVCEFVEKDPLFWDEQ